MARLRAHIGGIQHHAPRQPGLNAELIVVSGRNLAGRIGRVQVRRSKQHVARVDVLREAVVQRRLNRLGRIADEVEHAVALEAVVVDAAAGADHDVLLAGDIPRDAETRAPLRAAVLLQILVDALASLADAVERIAGARHFQADVERRQVGCSVTGS